MKKCVPVRDSWRCGHTVRCAPRQLIKCLYDHNQPSALKRPFQTVHFSAFLKEMLHHLHRALEVCHSEWIEISVGHPPSQGEFSLLNGRPG